MPKLAAQARAISARRDLTLPRALTAACATPLHTASNGVASEPASACHGRARKSVNSSLSAEQRIKACRGPLIGGLRPAHADQAQPR